MLYIIIIHRNRNQESRKMYARPTPTTFSKTLWLCCWFASTGICKSSYCLCTHKIINVI